MYIEKLESLISQNKDIFYKELKEVIKPSFDGLDNPSKYKKIVHNMLKKANRKSFARQARLVSAATEYITKKNNKSLLVSSEMGTGKCILPHSQIVINGQVLSIEHAYELYADKTSQIIDDENFNASWFVPNTKLLVPSYCEKSRKIVDKEVKHIYKQKVSEEIRKVTTDGNYSIDTTKAHKFLTPNGWTNQIKIGDYVAIPKRENFYENKTQQPVMDVSLVAWILAEGYIGSNYKCKDGTESSFFVSITQKDKYVADEIKKLANNDGSFTVVERVEKGLNCLYLYQIKKLFECGVNKNVSKYKEIPAFVMNASREDVKKFLAAYFDAEGSVTNDNRGMIEISSASKMIVYQLSSLLRRIGIVSRITTTEKMATNGKRIMRTYYRLNISGSSARKFALEILPYSIVDYKKERLSNLCDIVVNNNLETIYVYDLIVKLKEITGLSRAKSDNIFANVYINGQQKTVNDFTVFKIIKLIDDILSKELKIEKDIDEQLLINIKNELYSRLEQDIFFVKVKKIEEYNYDGYVYDLSVDTTHNFIAENMLVHNTDMGLKLSMSDKFKVNFILCPPHLVDKWEDEIKVNYVDHKSFKVIKVNRWEDLIPYTKRDMRKDGIKYYFIISRETAKLGYPKQPAIKISFKQIIKEKMLDGESLMVKQLVKVARCPDCYSVLEEGNSEFIDTSTIPYKCECGAVLRSVDRTVSPKMQTRVSIAEYIKRTWTKGAIDLLIVDEIHEYKGGNTGQGNALAQLASMSKKIVGLTGTLLNGYASSLFYILYRLNPNLMKKRLGYDYNQVKLFVETYGAHEQIVEAKEVTHEGVVTKMGKQISLKEKPKISPYLLSVLLDMTIFLRLDEIKMDGGLGLPDYDESIELVEMDENLRKPYMAYLGEISSRIRKDKRFLGNLATDAIAVPDMPFQIHSAQNEIFYEPEFTREDYGYTNKEKRLLEIVKSELKNGRRCLVYVHFSNKGVGDDITNMLTKELPQYSTKFLSPTIAAKKRQAWIEKNPSDVLVCNPELVKTGLDLLQFPTIIFYETTYNVFTLKQASRRSWRIGQRDDVKVMFMAYENTPQHKALELIGAKVAAANSLEGRLSGDDDLSSMADEDDNIQLALAKAILKGESASKDIQMNSIKNFGNDRDWDNFELWYKEQMELYKELPKSISEPKIVDDLFKNFESVKTVAFSKDDRDWQMYKNMAKELLEIYHNGNLYGKQNKYTDDKGKEQTSWSYAGGSHCFERCDEYNNGLVDGLSYSINRASSNYCIVNGIEIYRVKIGKAPFEPVPNSKILMPILKFEEFIDESKEDIEALANLIKEFVNSHKSEKAVIADSLFDFDEELTSNTFFYYSGKGKNKKKVEVNSANLVGYVPPEDLKGGIQLSLF